MSLILILIPILMLAIIGYNQIQSDEQNTSSQAVPIPIEVEPFLTKKGGNHDS